jgi:hypothetical protein
LFALVAITSKPRIGASPLAEAATKPKTGLQGGLVPNKISGVGTNF